MFAEKLVSITEKYLTYRRRKKLRVIARQRKRGVLKDWLYSFLWAASVVLILNQYLIQGYQIPSGSMIPTLHIGDKIFVNKLAFGPELLPGYKRIYRKKTPQRFEVVVFESPEYLSKGVVFEILQRIIYMLTLSFIDINKDAQGNPRVQFLIKRLIGKEGDTIRYKNNSLEYKVKGSDAWLLEEEFRQFTAGGNFSLNADAEGILENAREYAKAWFFEKDARRPSNYEDRMKMAQYAHQMFPSTIAVPLSYEEAKNGWYIPKDHFFFMGDNRDNSYDSRFYGTVSKRNVLGKALIVYLPTSHFGLINK